MDVMSEAYIVQRLDEMCPTPVPYVGKPPPEQMPLSARQMEKIASAERRALAEKHVAQRAQFELEKQRRMQISASQPSVMAILAAVACAHGIPLTVVLSKNKNDRVARARQHAIWQLKQRKPTLSSVQVGQILKRDSSTVRDGLIVFEANRHRYEDQVQAVAKLLSVQDAA